MKRRVRFSYGIIIKGEKVYDDDTKQMINRRVETQNKTRSA